MLVLLLYVVAEVRHRRRYTFRSSGVDSGGSTGDSRVRFSTPRVDKYRCSETMGLRLSRLLRNIQPPPSSSSFLPPFSSSCCCFHAIDLPGDRVTTGINPSSSPTSAWAPQQFLTCGELHAKAHPMLRGAPFSPGTVAKDTEQWLCNSKNGCSIRSIDRVVDG